MTQINALNRSLEGIIEVRSVIRGQNSTSNTGQIGNEFAQVEALWSQFENVMGNGQAAEEERRNQDHHRPGENGQS